MARALHERHPGAIGGFARAAAAVLVALAALSSCDRGVLATNAWNRLPQIVLDRIDGSIWGVFDRCGGTLGTAFVVEHEGSRHLVTSLHVIRGFRLDEPLDRQLAVSRSEVHGKMRQQTTTTLTGVRVVHADDILDIAVMTADGIDDLPALALSPFRDQRIRVFAVGLAQAKDYYGMSITEGIVSNPDKEVVVESRAFRQTHIEHTAPLVGGQSGGPLVDMRGRVVGVDSFARGDRPGLILYYATPLRKVLDTMDDEGRLEIRNGGTGRIKEIYVTPFPRKPAEIDRLPLETGKLNGHSAIRFGIKAGRYSIRMVTEEREPTVRNLEIVAGETAVIDYSYKSSGIRITNAGCRKILTISLLNPIAQTMMKGAMEDPGLGPEEKADRIRKLILSQDLLERDVLAPGQAWVEWVTDWTYHMYVFTWDPSIGEFVLPPDPREVTVTKDGITDVYLYD
jgi:hypothetical protein